MDVRLFCKQEQAKRLIKTQLHVPNLKSERDAMIAAISIVHGFKLVSRNESDFKHINVELINPWLAVE